MTLSLYQRCTLASHSPRRTRLPSLRTRGHELATCTATAQVRRSGGPDQGQGRPGQGSCPLAILFSLGQGGTGRATESPHRSTLGEGVNQQTPSDSTLRRARKAGGGSGGQTHARKAMQGFRCSRQGPASLHPWQVVQPHGVDRARGRQLDLARQIPQRGREGVLEAAGALQATQVSQGMQLQQGLPLAGCLVQDCVLQADRAREQSRASPLLRRRCSPGAAGARWGAG